MYALIQRDAPGFIVKGVQNTNILTQINKLFLNFWLCSLTKDNHLINICFSEKSKIIMPRLFKEERGRAIGILAAAFYVILIQYKA